MQWPPQRTDSLAAAQPLGKEDFLCLFRQHTGLTPADALFSLDGCTVLWSNFRNDRCLSNAAENNIVECALNMCTVLPHRSGHSSNLASRTTTTRWQNRLDTNDSVQTSTPNLRPSNNSVHCQASASSLAISPRQLRHTHTYGRQMEE